MRRLSLAVAMAMALTCAVGPTGAQSEPAVAPATIPTDSAERKIVISQLADALEADYVFPEIGTRYAAALRAHLQQGAYDGFTDPAQFGSAVTADLQSVAPDKHVRLALQSSLARPQIMAGNDRGGTGASAPRGLEEARMIGNTAYLRFNEFPDDPGTAQAARSFLLSHADAEAIVIDARANRGGGLLVMDAILPLLYASKADLVRMDTRAAVDDGGPLRTSPTLVLQPSSPLVVSRDHVVTPDPAEKRLQRTPVYYLVSGRTASAAEHLALALKRTHRAVLVGEATAGADHFGFLQPMGTRFAAFIPVVRTYDPLTGWDWEGKGVAPDVAVPADEALTVALERAKNGPKRQ